MTISSAQFLMMQARTQASRPRIKCAEDVEREADLQNQILEECKAHGWIAFHGSMAHKTKRTPGEPDFTVLADNGRFFLVECKDRDGEPSTEQRGVIMWAAKLGHTVHIVRNIEAFRELTGVQRTFDNYPHHD